MYTIKNCPRYAEDHPYIVATEVGGTLWFYGAYDDLSKAYSAAYQDNRSVFENDPEEVTLEFAR